jgi:peptidoglycan/xylan/chitin deacetylase (PgdA/CDA1 family)
MRNPNRDTIDLPECRFLLGSAAEDAFREWVVRDARSARLSPAFKLYYRFRALVPRPLRRLLQRVRPVETADQWYIPREFADALSGHVAARGGRLRMIHPWPDGAQLAFVLTHDVETAEGLRRVANIADLEEELGFRSSWNIVPHKYSVDRGLLEDLKRRGFEIGIHGYNHDGRLFTSRATFNRRVPAINAALRSYGAVGFRAPMVHRNLAWLQSLDVEYDASCFDADPYQAMPGGVGGPWPFLAGRFVELPYTLPQDHTLFIVLAQRDESIWIRKLEYLAGLAGMALVITHPDYLDSADRLGAYRRFLEAARERSGMWHVLPKEVAAWWRQRDASMLALGEGGDWTIQGPAAGRGRAATVCARNGVVEIRPDHHGAIADGCSVDLDLSRNEFSADPGAPCRFHDAVR